MVIKTMEKHMSKFDIKQSAWERDIASWNRWLTFYKTISNKDVKERVRSELSKIQQRWPAFIKESEIPID